MTTPNPKPPTQPKKHFTKIVTNLQQQYKNNQIANKNYNEQLIDSLTVLYKDVRKCYETIINYKNKTGDNNLDNISINVTVGLDERCCEWTVQPFGFVQYFRRFCQAVCLFCQKIRDREDGIRSQMANLFSIQGNPNFLQILAKKALQNYDLSLKVQQLTTNLQLKCLECKLAQKTTQQYQKKFKQYQKDYYQVVVAISNILKDCQLSQIQLRQQNRLQKELIQTHKIEFQRYKMDFKLKPSFQEKIRKIKNVLERKYQEREGILIKQTQKITKNSMKEQFLRWRQSAASKHKQIKC